jgi:uncharacterized protein
VVVWADRFSSLPTATVLGRELPVATTRLARLAGLALLDRGHAGDGLLIPHCNSAHTVGMRFALELIFIDRSGRVVELRRSVPPWRFACCPSACSVIELPSPEPEARSP